MHITRKIVFTAIALCLLGGTTFLTVALIYPPAPLPADAPATDFSATRAARFLLLEETTGVQSFPGLETQPAPGTMRNPGGYDNGMDFTAIYRHIDLPAAGGK